MLTVKQIKKLGGRAITDKALVKGNSQVWIGPGLWSNGQIAIFEDAPDLGLEVRPLTEGIVNEFRQALETDSPLYPAEVVGFDDHDLRLIRFTDGFREGWFIGSQVNAILKRAGKKADVQFCSADWQGHLCLTIRNGKPLGLIMPYVVSEHFAYDWNFAYTGELPA